MVFVWFSAVFFTVSGRFESRRSTTFFEIISMLLIVSNVVFCGIEAEILSQNPERAVEVGLDVVPRIALEVIEISWNSRCISYK